MNRRFEVYPSLNPMTLPRVLFALELLDAVTLARVWEGCKLKAIGLQGKPVVNAGGMFVWRQEVNEDIDALQKICIDLGALPYEAAELSREQVKLPPEVTTIELAPRVDYPFGIGMTAVLGTLCEARVPAPEPPQAVHDAKVHLRWLDQDGVWRDAPTRSSTRAKSGDFVSILRLAPGDAPQLNEDGLLTARLHFERDRAGSRHSAALMLRPGRVATASSLKSLNFAWDELTP